MEDRAADGGAGGGAERQPVSEGPLNRTEPATHAAAAAAAESPAETSLSGSLAS